MALLPWVTLASRGLLDDEMEGDAMEALVVEPEPIEAIISDMVTDVGDAIKFTFGLEPENNAAVGEAIFGDKCVCLLGVAFKLLAADVLALKEVPSVGVPVVVPAE